MLTRKHLVPITSEDWNIMLGLTRVSRLAFVTDMHSRPDAVDADLMYERELDKLDAAGLITE